MNRGIRFLILLACCLIFSSRVSAQIKEEINLEGVLLSYYLEDPEGKDIELKHELLVLKDKKAYKLKLKKKLKNKNGKIRVKGYRLTNEIEVTEIEELGSNSTLNRATNTSFSDVNGTERVLVTLIKDSLRDRAGGYEPTKSEAHEFIFSSFGSSLNNYLQETSSNRLNLIGDTLDWIEIPNLCSPYNSIGDLFIQGLEAAGSITNIENYDRFIFIIPEFSQCLPSNVLGVGNLGKVDADGLRFSINITRYINPASKFSKLGQFALFHEFGHNLGLEHDNANACGKKVLSQNCESIEYGGSHSIMGHAHTLAHFNAIHKDSLGWLTDSEIQTVTPTENEQEFIISPISRIDSSLKTIKIPLPNGSSYYLEYRQPEGFDAIKVATDTSVKHDGLLIYLRNDNYDIDSILLDPKMNTYLDKLSENVRGKRYISSFSSSFHYTAPTQSSYIDTLNEINITPVNFSSTGVTVRISKINSVTEEEPPQTVAGNYQISIKNYYGSNTDYHLDKEYYLQLEKTESWKLNTGVYPVKVEWDFDGDDVSDSYNYSLYTSSLRFKKTGYYAIKAIIHYNDNSMEIVSKAIKVYEYSSIWTLFSNGVNKVKKNDPIYFYLSRGINVYTVGTSDVAKMEWDFDGDGDIDNESISSKNYHYYDQSGSYTATVKITYKDDREPIILSEQIEVVDQAVGLRIFSSGNNVNEDDGRLVLNTHGKTNAHMILDTYSGSTKYVQVKFLGDAKSLVKHDATKFHWAGSVRQKITFAPLSTFRKKLGKKISGETYTLKARLAIKSLPKGEISDYETVDIELVVP